MGRALSNTLGGGRNEYVHILMSRANGLEGERHQRSDIVRAETGRLSRRPLDGPLGLGTKCVYLCISRQHPPESTGHK